MNAPEHPLEAELAELLLPHVCPWSSIDPNRIALTVARTLLENWERLHRIWQEDKR